VLSEDRLDLRFHRRRVPRDAEILGRSKTEVARVNRSYFTKGRLHHPSILVDNTATQNVKTIEPVAIGAFVPTDRILNRGKMVSTGNIILKNNPPIVDVQQLYQGHVIYN
jgi:hypothetical protein